MIINNPRVLCNIQATHPRACVCIFHKTLGLMLYPLHTAESALNVPLYKKKVFTTKKKKKIF